jgi:hypothetical protein
MIKVCWISPYIKTPELFLQTIIKMTPNRKGVWKDLQAVSDPLKADFVLVMDWTDIKIPLDRTIFFGEHPSCLKNYRAYTDMLNSALLCLPLNKFLNPGEWWIDYDYDYLSALKPPVKTKKSVCCFTAKTSSVYPRMYGDRLKFMEKMVQNYKDIDIFGRPEANFRANPILNPVYKGVMGNPNPNGLLGEHMSGKESLINYRYTLEFDNGPTKNYFSERFYDSMLLWCMPIYWGSSNVHEFLPENSFRYVDIENYSMQEVTKIINILESDYREQNMEALTIARDMLLNKHQMWAYMHEIIHNLDIYIKKWKN